MTMTFDEYREAKLKHDIAGISRRYDRYRDKALKKPPELRMRVHEYCSQCVNWRGKCRALSDTDFGEDTCPFFKEVVEE